VNSTKGRALEPAGATTGTGNGNAEQTQHGMRVYPAQNRGGNEARVPPAANRMNGREMAGRQGSPTTRTAPPPPNVPRSVTSERVFNQVGSSGGGGGRAGGASGASGASTGGGGRGSAPSGGASGSGGRSSGGGSSAGGGGRPHWSL